MVNQGVRENPVRKDVPPESNIQFNEDPVTYIDRKLAGFCQQLLRPLLRSIAEKRLIFSPTITQYQIPPEAKLLKLVHKYLGTTSPTEHLENYAVHMALNPDHDTLKCELFGITLGEYA